MAKIAADEFAITGSWDVVDGEARADAACHRIEELLRSYLTRRGADESGWNVLYEDPVDGRLWELTFPWGHMQGGGPPSLKMITPEHAVGKSLLKGSA